MADVIVIGAGHNALVATTLLARAGLSVVAVESADVVGGAARTETPFPKVPGLRQSTGAYLLGLMPPELVTTLGIDLPLLRRDPHYFLPTTGAAYLLMGSDRDAVRRNYEAFFSPEDWRADEALQAEIGALREDLAPAWLAEPLTVEDTAARYVRPALRSVFVDLCRGSVADYLARFDFTSDLVVAMYAVTDGLSGMAAGPDTPGSGHNFLVHNMCRLPGADGTWMIVRGGMGTVTSLLADAARAAGAQIRTSSRVDRVVVEGGAVAGVVLDSGEEIRAHVVVGGCDPYVLMRLAGDAFPTALRTRMEAVRKPGSTLKVNLALRDLPTFTCAPDVDPFGATIHLLPDGGLDGVRKQWDEVQAGRLPEFPTIEWYVHTTVDPSLRDAAGHHSSALFVQSVPYGADVTSYVPHLLSICDRFAPGTSDLVADVFALPPQGIEAHFGITGGHIHHVDNGVAFADRMPYATGLDGLYACSAGCHPAGSVIGAAGHNAAIRVLQDLGR